MTTARHHHRLAVWIALIAMLVLALVPTLSRAMAFANGTSTWAEICTPQGMKQVSSVDGEEAPVQAGAHLDHCALCGLATDAAAPLPASPLVVQLPLHRAEPPRLFLQATTTLHAWCSAQPRAPPTRS